MTDKIYAYFEIEGNEAVLCDKNGEVLERIDLLTLIDIWLDEQGYEINESFEVE